MDNPPGPRAADLLTPEQLVGLGKVAAEWGMLEAALNSHATTLTKTLVGWALLTGNPGGRRTAELLSQVLPRYLPEHPHTSEKLMAILGSISGLADRRNDVLHAAWVNIAEAKSAANNEYEPFRGSEPNWAYLFKQQGRTLKQFPMGANELEALASEIANARLRMNALMWSLPAPYGYDYDAGQVS